MLLEIKIVSNPFIGPGLQERAMQPGELYILAKLSLEQSLKIIALQSLKITGITNSAIQRPKKC